MIYYALHLYSVTFYVVDVIYNGWKLGKQLLGWLFESRGLLVWWVGDCE